jgi:Cft2 family RNA processing exonuclease
VATFTTRKIGDIILGFLEAIMRLTFLGGADEVGASSTLIEIGGKVLVVDAGIRISPKTNKGIANDQLPDLYPITQAGGPDYVLVTHAHTDHTGALPLVVGQYPHVPVLATLPTIELTRVLQADAQKIMRSRFEEEGELPIFDELASNRLMESFQPVGLRQPIPLGDSLQVTYHASGHIAGAASLVIESEDGVLVMSGDVSIPPQRAVVGAAKPRIKADALVLESTYGGRLHANRLGEEQRLILTLKRVVERGGKVLIPAFALGRAQEILQILLAYRDQLDVPVHVDGMVRAVCRSYGGFADWLPEATVAAAGEAHLFFRSGIRPVDGTARREEILHLDGPCVVVASSGMLTGGAAAAYAKVFAGDPRNAILLTGYQDEEAPGRFLQRMMRERQEHAEVPFQINNSTVTLRCEVDTYSLSAHADEDELLGHMLNFDPVDTMLVHGDPGARHSLATKLRERGRGVILPRIGQTLEFNYPRRPMQLARRTNLGMSDDRPVDVPMLWGALKMNAGSFYGARELARMWWNDENRVADLIRALAADAVHFAADWRKRDTFRVRTPEQIEKVRKQRAVMLAHPDLIGQFIALRDSNERPRLGVVVNANEEGFEAVVEMTKGRNYPGDQLLWVLGPWEGPPETKGMKDRIAAMAQEARALSDTILPYEVRRASIGRTVDPRHLLPEALPDEITPLVALAAVVLALAGDDAIAEEGGLQTRRALQGEPMEQNAARQAAMAMFAPEARLRKVGMEIHRMRLVLTFDFPERAQQEYGEQIENLADVTGWNVLVNPTVSQQALGAAAEELLPEGGRIVKGPAFHMDRREVQVDAEGVDDVNGYAAEFARLTGYKLRVSQRNAPNTAHLERPHVAAGASDPGMNLTQEPDATPPLGAVALSLRPGGDPAEDPSLVPLTATEEGRRPKLEINAAYALIRQALEPHGLYRCSFKGGAIVLSFISPQVGARHAQTVRELASKTGYLLSIHPHANQQQILQVAGQVFRQAGWQVRKGPGVHVDRAEVVVTLMSEPTPDVLQGVMTQFEQQTGYRLVASS